MRITSLALTSECSVIGSSSRCRYGNEPTIGNYGRVFLRLSQNPEGVEARETIAVDGPLSFKE